MFDPYAPHRAYVARAAAVTQPRAVVAVFITYVGAFFAVPMAFYLFLPDAIYEEFALMSSGLSTIANFAMFGISAAIFVHMLRRVHGRGFWSLIGPYRVAWYDLRYGAAGVVVLLLLLHALFPYVPWSEVTLTPNLIGWVLLLPFALFAILVQVTTEEIVFRGYLQQQLACLSSSRWVWMVFPSVVFGAWHYWNGNSTPEGIAYAIWAGMLGIALADLTARSGTLGAAIGMHFGVNVTAVMIVGIEDWPLSGMALFFAPYYDPDTISAEIAQSPNIWLIFSILGSALSVFIIWLAARNAIRR